MSNSKLQKGSALLSYENFVHAIAGGCGSAFAMTTFYPLDVVRTKFQVDEKYQAKNTLAGLMEIYQNEGISGLYCGLFPVIESLYCSNFVYFYSFHTLKRILNTEQSPLKNLLLGMIAGWINVFSTTPLWVVNTRMKMQGKKARSTLQPSDVRYKNLLDGLFRIYSEEGASSLWSGTSSSLILAANPAIQFMVYESIKARVNAGPSGKPLSSATIFCIAAAAKTVATVITYPLQLVQTKQRHGHNYQGLPQKPGILALMNYIIRRNGVRGLYKGLESKILQTVLTSALMFVFYEKIVSFVFRLLLGTTKPK